MVAFSMKIAGYTAKVSSLFESTPQYFRAYLSQEEPTLLFTVTREELAAETAQLWEIPAGVRGPWS